MPAEAPVAERAPAGSLAGRAGRGRLRWRTQLFAVLVVAAVTGLLTAGSFHTFVRPTLVTVPDVKGRSAGDARAVLERLGLGVDQGITSPAGFAPGQVAAQVPPAGSGLRPGGRVEIDIAADPTRIDVQKSFYVGRKSAEVVAALRTFGFVVRVEQVSSESPQDSVVDVSPTGLVLQGDPVRVVVSKGLGG
ncbi:PASTA domain-containing protein [Solihabitans fulvus]|uniref:PASTA domain-containing protein n=1 Tax=Solihabitans fulvus TaxID=1892852 RepID=A0A5B2XI51_9PSEU|nr:PASTA domain-containing protein [Solihabitans fulvus]KAA2262611.1 PASTA domain-containing protein [Solihabitans fulvus]